MSMKKRVLISLSIVLLVTLLVILSLFFKEIPVLTENSVYHITSISVYSGGDSKKQHFDEQSLNALGTQWKETERDLLASLSSCTKRRSAELLFHRNGSPIQTPDWIQLCVTLVDENGRPMSILLGHGKGQQRNFLYDPPVYNLSQVEQLFDQWTPLLQSLWQ